MPSIKKSDTIALKKLCSPYIRWDGTSYAEEIGGCALRTFF